MYLKTPRRYRRGGYRGRPIISLWRLLLMALAVVLIVIGVGVYQNRDLIVPEIQRAADDLVGEADRQIREARATAPPPTQDPTIDLQLAEDAWQRGAMQDVIVHYGSAIASTPDNLQAQYRLALAYINQGELDLAQQAAADAITANPYAPDAWTVQAMALNRLDRPGEAVSSALRALELVPESLVAQDNRLAPSRARALAALAEAYLELGQGERASSTIEEALEVYPDSYEAFQVQGRVQQEYFFDLTSARESFAAAYDLRSNMPYIAIWLARIDSALQNYENAINVYEDVLQQNPDNPTALYDLGSYYLRVEGNPDEARTYYNRCVESDPDNGDCHWMLARTLLDAESQSFAPEEALRLLLIANDLDDQNPLYMWWTARAYNSLGQCQMSLPYLENGYRIAQAQGNDSLVADFEFSLNEAASCGAVVPGGAGAPGSTPTATPEPDV